VLQRNEYSLLRNHKLSAVCSTRNEYSLLHNHKLSAVCPARNEYSLLRNHKLSVVCSIRNEYSRAAVTNCQRSVQQEMSTHVLHSHKLSAVCSTRNEYSRTAQSQTVSCLFNKKWVLTYCTITNCQRSVPQEM